ncbi:MAG: hypothetical protein U1A23_04105 [Candidatus Sungbacteria bacterium]|nr:hypothetical protein [bacterium]MDZ4286087.1 hypothetical protein [Candidatus Sungbacteria bacterium]
MHHDHHHGPQHHHEHTLRGRSGDEYYYCIWLFVVSLAFPITEFLIALVFAHSISAQADAIHALTHLLLAGLMLWISRQVLIRQMSGHEEDHYREQFTYWYAGIIFVGLGWLIYNSFEKLVSAEAVVGGYMLLSVSVGIIGNGIALKLLNTISKVLGTVAGKSGPYRLFRLDTWVDFSISLFVLITAIAALVFPSFPIRFVDPGISLVAASWIGWSGIQILRQKNLSHSH